MIWELLLWAQPKISELNQTILSLNLNQSNLILSLYLITHARTSLMGLSFFCVEISGMTNGFGLYAYNWHIYFGYLLIYCWFSLVQLRNRKSKSLASCCLVLLLTCFYASVDAYINPKTQSAFYLAYPDLMLCIHVCIILSFYHPKTIINNMVDKLRDIGNIIRNAHVVNYCWYTIGSRY